mmetsp:Transcript_11699/g.34689  ORF Transcript_11699/g.34689 Transcript_11699/m.34689 type:complete len:205 (-) Transcript_11699:321-935(-)
MGSSGTACRLTTVTSRSLSWQKAYTRAAASRSKLLLTLLSGIQRKRLLALALAAHVPRKGGGSKGPGAPAGRWEGGETPVKVDAAAAPPRAPLLCARFAAAAASADAPRMDMARSVSLPGGVEPVSAGSTPPWMAILATRSRNTGAARVMRSATSRSDEMHTRRTLLDGDARSTRSMRAAPSDSTWSCVVSSKPAMRYSWPRGT